MPRQARIDAPGALHHIICRGIERRKIFYDDHDRNSFLKRLGPLLLKTSTQCLAWTLIPNHFHLLLRTGTSPIASIMERLLTGYAGDFNRRHNRHGHLFQNRYKSILCQTEPYLLELVRYIHLNPIRVGMVKTVEELANFAYTGHPGIVIGDPPVWQCTEEVLYSFGHDLRTARQNYESYVVEGVTMGKRPDLIGGGLVRSSGGWERICSARRCEQHLKSDERILGDSDFVEQVLRDAQERLDRASLTKAEGMNLDGLAQKVAEALQMDSAEIWKPGKKALTVRGRSLLCYWAITELGMTAEAVSKQIRLSESGVIRAAQRGEQLSQITSRSLD